MNGKSIEDVAERVIQEVELADTVLEEQFDGMAPGLREVDDETFYVLFMMRQAEYGPDFARALDAKKDDGTDLVPGGRALLRRFTRIQRAVMLGRAMEKQERVMTIGGAWAPEPYGQPGVSDGAYR